MSKYDELQRKLREIFQIDRPELDFGIYRILNARAAEIRDYLDNRLKTKVQSALAASDNTSVDGLRLELIEKETQYRSDGINPDSVQKILALRQKIAEYGTGGAEKENAVFTHLLTFFSRYYDKGDFISQRRYKGDTYAIPYSGEEVVLHWANKDQYYTKSGEYFSNYVFRLSDGRTVRFRLVSADTAKDNRKDNDRERRFVLVEPQTRTITDDEGAEHEEKLVPVAEVNGALELFFDYKPMPKGTKQADLVTLAVRTILDHPVVANRWSELADRMPTEKNPLRTLLEKCLTSYTEKNLADYFIHKDLGGFLRRELDFYIKNEVMNLDDVQRASSFAAIEKNLRMIKILRSIALDLITFLSQLEEFQKKLWLKKKFVVSAHYCMTLDRVPERLYPAIAANEKQWEQWRDLGMMVDGGRKADLFSQIEPGTVAYLKEHRFLMVDTSLFDAGFRQELLQTVENLDETTDGLLIQGDNFQALNLLQERYREQVKCVYIDPPYNTDGDGFCYKDKYQSSSWCSMMFDRLEKSKWLVCSEGTITSAIGREELLHLLELKDGVFGVQNRIADLVWEKGRNNDAKYFSLGHDYMLVYGKNIETLKSRNTAWREEKPGSVEILTEYRRLKKIYANDYSAVQSGIREFYQQLDKSHPALKHRRYNRVDKNGLWRDDNISWPGGNGPRYDVIHPKTGLPCKVPDSGWRFATYQKFKLYLDHDFIEFREDHTEPPLLKRYLNYVPTDFDPDVRRRSTNSDEDSSNVQVMPSVFYKGQQPTVVAFRHLMGADVFRNPKEPEIIARLFGYMGNSSDYYLDYFAGSGTTGHAVINLNRADNGKRKYILVEQGDYFDTVLKPRIQKVVYSADWKDGKAVAPQTGVSHAFKVLRIESYEDTLNNLELRRTAGQERQLSTLPEHVRDEYLMSYMLDIESRGSLLSVEQFRKPFDCRLKIAIDSAGAYEERPVDLLETFNYLIGLRVRNIDMHLAEGYALVRGTLPTGEKTLIIWRDAERIGYDELGQLCEMLDVKPGETEFEVVYINADHNIPSSFTTTEAEGGVTKTLKIRQIEPKFLERMFSVEGV
jgi:adenine-specific DNA-methyltransferase